MKPTIFALLALSLSMPSSRAHEEIDYDITSEHEGLREAANRENDIAPILAALKREPTGHDKKLLMGIPVPVWREILGAPERPQDPLAPPDGDMEVPLLIPFVSINEEDPSPEMTPVLNAHFPGWRPGSRAEETKGKDDAAGYRDKQSHEAGLLVQIALVSTTSKNIAGKDSGKITSYVRSRDLPAYQFKVRRATGPFLAGGGWGGHVVLLAGYWVKAGSAGWDE